MEDWRQPRKETPLSPAEIQRIARAPFPSIGHYGGASWGGAMPLPDDTTPRNEYDAWRALRSQHSLPRRNDEESGE
jgi:hypothetical protein